MTTNAKHKRITVLNVSPLNMPVRSDFGYSPMETVIYNLDKGLHSLGYRSIVACSGDSKVAGEKYITVERSLGGYCSEKTLERRKIMYLHLSRTLKRAKIGDIDIIHVHDVRMLEYIYSGMNNTSIPIVLTLHVPARDFTVARKGIYQQWGTSKPLVYFVPISEYQKREYYGIVKTVETVYHGIEVEGYPAKKKPDKRSYLFTIGRLTKNKGQDKAIELAKKTGSKLIIAGCVQNKLADKKFFTGLRNSIDLLFNVASYPVDSDYYEKVMKPLLECDKQIIYIGEINSEQKKLWYRYARASLFPIQWGEPFGLVLIESMACGTPILAFKEGSIPEIVADGKTGFVVDSLNAMIERVSCVDTIDPIECRRYVQKRFCVASMASKYSRLYKQIINLNNADISQKFI